MTNRTFLPDSPYANIRVADGGKFVVTWGVGFHQYGLTERRSVASAFRLRDRKMRSMETIAARTRLATAELDRHSMERF